MARSPVAVPQSKTFRWTGWLGDEDIYTRQRYEPEESRPAGSFKPRYIAWTVNIRAIRAWRIYLLGDWLANMMRQLDSVAPKILNCRWDGQKRPARSLSRWEKEIYNRSEPSPLYTCVYIGAVTIQAIRRVQRPRDLTSAQKNWILPLYIGGPRLCSAPLPDQPSRRIVYICYVHNQWGK